MGVWYTKAELHAKLDVLAEKYAKMKAEGEATVRLCRSSLQTCGGHADETQWDVLGTTRFASRPVAPRSVAERTLTSCGPNTAWQHEKTTA